jgi:hypothetical protein
LSRRCKCPSSPILQVLLAICNSVYYEGAQDAGAWSLDVEAGRTSNGWEEDAEEHQETVGAAHIGCCW